MLSNPSSPLFSSFWSLYRSSHRSVGALFCIGKMLYGYGYASNGPNGRYIGGIVSHLGGTFASICSFQKKLIPTLMYSSILKSVHSTNHTAFKPLFCLFNSYTFRHSFDFHLHENRIRHDHELEINNLYSTVKVRRRIQTDSIETKRESDNRSIRH